MTAKIQLTKLPYELNALEPYMSEETLNYHYGKHLQAYVNNINNFIQGTKFETMTLDQIIKESEGAMFNNAAQVMNHNMFFLALSPNVATTPTGELAKAINAKWGSFEEFKEQMEKDSLSLFGSGWTWLSVDKDGALVITKESNAENPLTSGLKPIMCIDVWEHSYYIDYRNNRGTYLNKLWSIIDWNIIADRFNK